MKYYAMLYSSVEKSFCLYLSDDFIWKSQKYIATNPEDLLASVGTNFTGNLVRDLVSKLNIQSRYYYNGWGGLQIEMPLKDAKKIKGDVDAHMASIGYRFHPELAKKLAIVSYGRKTPLLPPDE